MPSLLSSPFSLVAILHYFLYIQLSLSFQADPFPNATVYVFSPGDDTYVQSICDSVFKINGGTNPAFNGQWSNERYALLFKPGVYNVDCNVGYYTSIIGLGATPQETQIRNVISPDGDSQQSGGALCNFWRSAENFMTKQSASPLCVSS